METAPRAGVGGTLLGTPAVTEMGTAPKEGVGATPLGTPVEVVEQQKRASTDDIEEALRDVVDPELGINVIDLGLVYGVHVDEDNVATIDMTLTSAAHPLTDVIEDQTREALLAGPAGGLVKDFRINWVWMPPWGPDKINDDGREQLRALGFAV
ncbi:MAG: metal-sulfur cluster assembly factor [Actinomycetota bacterium]|nr:metal-sulfur cluster assembly factor [Actinomycetota bacterium]